MTPHHVVLVTYGEPPDAAFVAQLRYSWRILVGLTRTIAPIPRPLLPVIALARGHARWRLWTEQRYGSPLEAVTRRQARALAQTLRTREPGVDWRSHVAYEFRDPLLRDVLKGIPAREPVTIVPMYAADSAFTHALSRDVLAACALEWEPRPATRVVPALAPDVLGHVAADFVLASTRRHPGFVGPSAALVLAAHGTVLDPPRPVDTGREAAERLCAAIRDRLASSFGLVVNGWLNHTRGGRWTEPPIDEALARVVAAGFSRVVYYPFGFLGDNAETQLEGRLALRAHPGLEALHLDALDTYPPLIAALAAQVLARESAADEDRRAS